MLSVIVYDEDKGGKSDFLGKIIIPLLNIQNGPKKYVLKDEELMRRAKGTITLQMHLDFHLVSVKDWYDLVSILFIFYFILLIFFFCFI